MFENNQNRTVVAKTPSGEFRVEDGADGTWMVFDGECSEMMPYCFGHCCALMGVVINDDDADLLIEQYGEEEAKKLVEYDERLDKIVMKRASDGRCIAQDRNSKKCLIYENRPATCRNFHCSRGAHVRGFKLPNHVDRQSCW